MPTSDQLWNAYQLHRTEFYKQVMILSVAGLGFNLTYDDRPNDLRLNWPFNDWEAATFCFSVSLVSALVVFFFTAAYLREQIRINNPRVHNPRFSPVVAGIWNWLANFASATSYLSFGLAIWYTVSRFYG